MKQITNRALRTSGILGVLLVLCLILAPASVHASELTEQEVGAAVQTWVRHVTADAMPDAVIERMEPHQVKGETVAYIAHLSGGGFCLCGADDLVLPVYLYSPQEKYDPQNPNYQYILWEIETRLKYLREGSEKGDPKALQYQEALSDRDAFWEGLIVGRTPTIIEEKGVKAEPVIMELDLTSRWHQDSPYNDQCPVLTPPDEHTVVGCVATAMSQIMYYWQWPNTGVGNHNVNYNYRWRDDWDTEYLELENSPDIYYGWEGRLDYDVYNYSLKMKGYWDESLYEKAQDLDPNNVHYRIALKSLWNNLTHASTNWDANFGATTYQWNLMADTKWLLPAGGDVAVATLCYHAGIAVGMDYGICSSGAYGTDVDNALEDYFRYDSDAYDSERDIDEMTEEIQWLRPIVFWGYQSAGPPCTGGHNWVIFGYNKGTDPNRQFRMYMGDEFSPIWYSCDNMYGYDFHFCQGHVTRLAPLNAVKFVGDVNPGDGSPDDPYKDIEEAIAGASDGATLIFKAGSTNTFSADPLVINRPFTLKGHNVIIQKQ